MRCVVWFRRSFLSCILLVLTAISASAFAQSDLQYQLGPGDKLRVTVFGEEDLSGEFEIDGSGRISMPLIGVVDLRSKSLRQAEAEIVAMLLDGYLRNPKVSVDVLNYRPFYILGEVNEPGSYPYRAGMTVLNAVVLAGGYTPRADEDDITIQRFYFDSENRLKSRRAPAAHAPHPPSPASRTHLG